MIPLSLYLDAASFAVLAAAALAKAGNELGPCRHACTPGRFILLRFTLAPLAPPGEFPLKEQSFYGYEPGFPSFAPDIRVEQEVPYVFQ